MRGLQQGEACLDRDHRRSKRLRRCSTCRCHSTGTSRVRTTTRATPRRASTGCTSGSPLRTGGTTGRGAYRPNGRSRPVCWTSADPPDPGAARSCPSAVRAVAAARRAGDRSSDRHAGGHTSTTASVAEPVDQQPRGCRGGRPPAFDAELYKQRDVIERCFNRLKQFRNLATRCAKRAALPRRTHHRQIILGLR
jgi:transposase